MYPKSGFLIFCKQKGLYQDLAQTISLKNSSQVGLCCKVCSEKFAMQTNRLYR